MGYFSRGLEARAAVSLAFGAALFCGGWALGPADTPLRAAVIGAFSAALSASLAGFSFPGWPALSAAVAFFCAGMIQPVTGRGWLWECLLVACAAAAWAVTWRWARFGVEQAFGVSFQDADLPPEQPPRARSWLAGLGLVMGLALVLLWAFPLAPVLALPAACAMVFATARRLDANGCVAGVLCSLPLAYVLPRLGPSAPPESYPYDLAVLPPASPWLLSGLLICGAVIGHWLALWRGPARTRAGLTLAGTVGYGEDSSA
ncbi:MAG: hypothetical protein HY319_18530 [Armatimonadetes bacterium]|nr:hypothetical protein [Armatimonadota bacterium]